MPKMQRAHGAKTQGADPVRAMVRAAVWALVAWLVLLTAFAANGGPLFYYDTASYFEVGGKMLRMFGLFRPDAAGGAGGAAAQAAADGTVTGSRSAVYALLAAVLQNLNALWLLVMLQAAVLVLVLHLASRLVMAQAGQPSRAWPATAAASVAAALGSAGFYTAYLMPDIFAAVLLVAIAAIAAFATELRRGGALILLVLGALAVVMHPSHLAIALLAVPGVALACLAFRSRRWWLSVLLVGLIATIGVLERGAFSVTVQTTTREHVVYMPFFTARLIADGPGKAYLDATCPARPPSAGTATGTPGIPQPGIPQPGADAGADGGATASAGEVAAAGAGVMATCALNAQLQRPEQMYMERILFATDPARGSFALLDPATRRAIAAEQRTFLKEVLVSRPLGVIGAALRNTASQLALVSVDMTLPKPGIVDAVRRIDPDFPESLLQGRLADGAWVTTLTRLHKVYYLLSGLGLLALLALPHSGLPRRVRLFGVLIVLGILANAFVTGAISQPANRYGARVIFLLPAVLAMLLLALPRRETRT